MAAALCITTSWFPFASFARCLRPLSILPPPHLHSALKQPLALLYVNPLSDPLPLLPTPPDTCTAYSHPHPISPIPSPPSHTLVSKPWGSVQVCLLVIAQGYLGIAMKISATMMKRGHLKETAKVSRYLVAAGHTDFKQCLAGNRPLSNPTHHHIEAKPSCKCFTWFNND